MVAPAQDQRVDLSSAKPRPDCSGGASKPSNGDENQAEHAAARAARPVGAVTLRPASSEIVRPLAKECARTMRVLLCGAGRISSLLAFWSRAREQIRRFDPKNPRNPVHHVHASRIAASFDRADISAIDFRAMRQLFLRQASCLPKLPHIQRQDLSDLHDRKASALKSISPRSILYNRAGGRSWSALSEE